MISNREEVRKIFENDGYNVLVFDEQVQDNYSETFIEISDHNNREVIEPADSGESARKTQQVIKPVTQIIKPGTEGEYDIATIVEYLNWHMGRIGEIVINRGEIVKQAIYAILTGEHMLLLSRTGMAKSYLASSIFNIFEGARLFSSQASKDQTPDNYFGPYNIEEFRRGRIRHNIKGSIIEANLVFLDEFFDASDVVLRSLLSVLNERKFINGSEQIDAAVHTAIATAKYMRMN